MLSLPGENSMSEEEKEIDKSLNEYVENESFNFSDLNFMLNTMQRYLFEFAVNLVKEKIIPANNPYRIVDFEEQCKHLLKFHSKKLLLNFLNSLEELTREEDEKDDYDDDYIF